MPRKKIDYDRLFLRVFIISIVAIAILTATILISWFFEIDIESTPLWLGALILFLSASLIFTAPLYWKIASIFISIFAIAIFIFFLFGWPIQIGLMFGLAIVIFILFTYLTL